MKLLTPQRAKQWMKDVENEVGTVVTTGSTLDNTILDDTFLASACADINSVRGREEVLGEWVDGVGQLWTDTLLNQCRIKAGVNHSAMIATMQRVVLSVDPSSGMKDECGIVLVGRKNGVAYVLADWSYKGNINEWTDTVVEKAREYLRPGDLVLLETNNNAAAKVVLEQKNCPVRIEPVFQHRSKYQRAEEKANMAALNEAGSVTMLANGAEFTANQLSFTDMDLIKLMERCTRDIALAYGVPAVFANLEGESSYAERRAADRIFYKGWVHPRATWLIEQLEANLRRRFDSAAKLEIDKTQIDYIKEELGEEQERKTKLGIFTIDELRALTGDEPLPNGAGAVLAGGKAPALEAPAGAAATPEAGLAEQALAAATGEHREVGFSADTSRRPDQR